MFANNTVETCTGTGADLALAGAVTFTNEGGVDETTLEFGNSFADGDLASCFVIDSGGVIQVAGIYTYVAATNKLVRNDTWNWNGTVVDKNPLSNITLSGGTHTVRCDAAGKRFETGGVASGKIYTPPIFSELSSTRNVGSNRLSYSPMNIDHSGYYDSFAIQVITASTSGAAIMGLYTCKNGLPDKLIAEHLTSIDTTTTGLKTATFDGGSMFLEKGCYFGAINHSNSAAYRAAQVDSVLSNQFGAIDMSSNITTAWKNHAYSIPDPADMTGFTFSTGNCPIVGVVAT